VPGKVKSLAALLLRSVICRPVPSASPGNVAVAVRS
jgi:hypothetical protein